MPAVATALAPLSGGFSLLLNISEANAMLFSIPATFATIQGFILAFTNIIGAMANSRLLPAVLSQRHAILGTPVYAVLGGSALSFSLCFLDGYVDGLDSILFNICIFFGLLAYSSQCFGYIYLKHRYKSMERQFVSPVGIPGVVFATGVWALNLVSIVAFQGDGQVSVLAALLLVSVFSVYYQGYAKHRQTFSEDERKILFFVHVANNNAGKRTRRHSNGSNPRASGGRLRHKVMHWWHHSRAATSSVASAAKSSHKTSHQSPTHQDIDTSRVS
ncbi:Aste57867_25196 [Aphanomyces stellatus]|uniref:Aste57867_25196 protein n=1 Tax=Aphanomyces stellatus TaxID=120398 RepID=A0A485LSJ6_9STRA|nr:hypothetical protein As57867_025118 [Aphanomyces stellatus]VFU01823.1 Aste57867_25196 [Aphanomyces stellatus]